MLELLQRLWLYRTSVLYRGKIARAMIIVFCVHVTNVAWLHNDVALKLDVRTIGVGGYYVPVCGLMWPLWFPILKAAICEAGRVR